IANIRSRDPNILLQNVDNLERMRQFYAVNDVDVDRYPIDGQERMVMISAREVSQNNIPSGGTWQTKHLVYTHGFGAVANQVNTATPQGQPAFILQDIPPAGQPKL